MNVLEKILGEIKKLKRNQNSTNQDYVIGYMSALSTVEGILAGLDDGWIPAEERSKNIERVREFMNVGKKTINISYCNKNESCSVEMVVYGRNGGSFSRRFVPIKNSELDFNGMVSRVVEEWSNITELRKPSRLEELENFFKEGNAIYDRA